MKGFFLFFGCARRALLRRLLSSLGRGAGLRCGGVAARSVLGWGIGAGGVRSWLYGLVFMVALSVIRCTNACHRLAGILAHDVELFSGKRIFFGIVPF